MPRTRSADLPFFYFPQNERKVAVANDILRRLAAEHGLTVVRLHRETAARIPRMFTHSPNDMFHPNDHGYRVWADAFRPALTASPRRAVPGTDVADAAHPGPSGCRGVDGSVRMSQGDRRLWDMAKPSTAYRCTDCGWSTVKWVGRCAECQQGAPSSRRAPRTGIVRSLQPVAPTRRRAARPIAQVDAELTAAHRPSGIGEFDRVLGGGIVAGAAILLSGEPGVGQVHAAARGRGCASPRPGAACCT